MAEADEGTMTSHARLLRALVLATLSISGSCDPQSREQAEGIITVLRAMWQSQGNAFLTLSAANGVEKSIGIDFKEEPTSVEPSMGDVTFYTFQQTASLLGGNGWLQHYKLVCGAPSDDPNRTTTIVFWSKERWQGAARAFACNANTNHFEVEGDICSVPIASFCMVTGATSPARRSRCLNGPRCDDGFFNGEETGRDCGGGCAGCRVGEHCRTNADCSSQNCSSNTCAAASCSDGIKNGPETGVDCGGSCSGCAIGSSCSKDGDCTSGRCVSNLCAARQTCTGAPENGSAQLWNVLVELSQTQCGGILYSVFANSLSDAKQCAQTQGLTPITTLCSYWVQIDSSFEATIDAENATKAVTCAKRRYCSNCSPSVNQTIQCLTQL